MGDWSDDWGYHIHETTDPNHVLEYIDDCGLAHFKDGCIEDWS